MGLLLALAACAAPDVCTEMCTAAGDRFDACLVEGGVTWGASVGYESAADYDNWCDTYAWELRELGQDYTCADRQTLIEEGSCADYYEAWAIE